MTVIIHQITAVLEWPTEYAEQVKFAKKTIDACTGNANVTVPPATLLKANTDYTAFDKAATASDRRSTERPLHNDLKAIMSLFQIAADADAVNAESIILSGNFKVKKITINQKHTFKATHGLVSGWIDLEAPGGKSHTCHEWWYSADGVKFEREEPTIAAHTHKDGLTPGQYAWFNHQEIGKDGGRGLANVIKIMVQ